MSRNRSAEICIGMTLLLICSSLACNKGVETPAPAPPPAALPATAVPATDPGVLRSIARLLAGVENQPALLSDEAWQGHREAMDHMWQSLATTRLAEMRAWTARELVDLAAPRAPLFYPFAGPDALSAFIFFPRAQSYVLIGLEEPGEILLGLGQTGVSSTGVAELETARSQTLSADLERLRGSLTSLIEAGYFVTKKMQSDLRGGQLNGVLPVLLTLLIRTGHEPLSAHYIDLGADGGTRVVSRLPPEGAKAVRIEFRSVAGSEEENSKEENGEQESRWLYYLSRDLSNAGFAGDPDFLAFLHRLGDFNGFMKSAHYLLQTAEFSTLQELLLKRSLAILEDDSGVPLRAFDPERWQLAFHGVYTRTLPAYREWFQPDLAAVFAEQKIPPLGFSFGYLSEIGGGCLLLAERR